MTSEVLCRLRSVQLEILDEIVRICEKYGLRYYIFYGTLLGAVRHKGYIPWDDDIDIEMPRKDLIKFTKICKSELNPEFKYLGIETDNKYWLKFPKIEKVNTLFQEECNVVRQVFRQGIYVDIFPIDVTYKDIDSKIFHYKDRLIDVIYQVLQYRVTGINQSNCIAYRIIKRLTFFFSYKALYHLMHIIMRLGIGVASTGKLIDWCCVYGRHCFCPDDYEPAAKYLFEGKIYNGPKNYDKVLSQIYGDYMKLPPVEERHHHNPIKLSFNLDEGVIDI